MDSSTRRNRREERWQRQAERARDAFGLVLVLVLLTYLLASILDNRGWEAVLLTISAATTGVIALTSAHSPPRLVRAGLLVAALSVLLAIASAAGGGRLPLNIASFLVICLLAVSMAAVLQRVVTAGDVSSRTILGAISVYTALGLLFTWAYGLIDRIEGGGFFEGVESEGADFLFFSYTTLTTTGYGDLVPAAQFGRMVAGLEMMIGQIFLVTLVAGLVSLWRPGESLIRRRERRTRGSSPADPPATP